MKTANEIKVISLLLFATASLLFSACKKDAHKSPALKFKTGGSYTSADASLGKGTVITVGIIADKTEDELKTLNVSYTFDGASSTITKDNFTISTKDEGHYEKDY